MAHSITLLVNTFYTSQSLQRLSVSGVPKRTSPSKLSGLPLLLWLPFLALSGNRGPLELVLNISSFPLEKRRVERRSQILAWIIGRRGEISYKNPELGTEGQEIPHSKENAQNPYLALTKSLTCKLSEQTKETGGIPSALSHSLSP